MNTLIIVESPTKAKTISRFLGPDFTVKSSFGHIRDLPKSKIGIDVEHDFTPTYVIPTKARKTVTELKKSVKSADEICFATDADREGEAISWHLAQILEIPDGKIRRIVFHEITDEAIHEALAHPRRLDTKLVDAQQARRILDRLVGYELSPFLWRKVARGLSAGRVQSAALRLIVEREREIKAFNPEEYWTIVASLQFPISNSQFSNFAAQLTTFDEKTLDKFAIANEARAQEIITLLNGATWSVAHTERKTVHRAPMAPFTTSTLQQEANRRLGFSAKQTMMLAQQLYEGIDLGGKEHVGLITYMRTDSVNLAAKFLQEAGSYIQKTFGANATNGPRHFTTKSKLAQEAHEAIRPTGVQRLPDDTAQHLDPRQAKLYDLIWRRAIASQMTDAVMDQTVVDSEARNAQHVAMFRTTGQIIRDPGFMRVWQTATRETELPDLKDGQPLTCERLDPLQHFTQPPARYTDASLVKILEEHGIGRPSTYAPTISTLINRHYVERGEGKKLVPTDVALIVNDVLVEHFPQIVDLNFTARMEDHFDEIAQGHEAWVPVIREFYEPFHVLLTAKYDEVKKASLTTEATDEICDKCGKPMVIRLGRFGKFLACTGFPECRNAKPIITDQKTNAPMSGTGISCPACGQGEITPKKSHRGKIFYSCNRYPECKFAMWDKPINEKCTTCGALMGETLRGIKRCSNKECSTRPPPRRAPRKFTKGGGKKDKTG